MASYKIPSRNIYEINNSKVVDNMIDKVEVAATRAVTSNRYNEAVYNNKFSSANYTIGSSSPSQNSKAVMYGVKQVDYVMVYGHIKPYYKIETISIPKVIDALNKISKIIGGIDNNGDANIRYSMSCEVKTAPATAKFVGHINTGTVQDITYTYPQSGTIQNDPDIPNSITLEEIYRTNPIGLDKIFAKTTVTFTDETNLKIFGDTLPIIDAIDEYRLDNCKFLCGAEIITFQDHGRVPAKGTGEQSLDYETQINGTATIYIPKTITITVYGNTIGFDLVNETISIGDGKNVFSFSGNELMQPNTLGLSFTDKYQTHVLDKWKDGKELATIKCPIEGYRYNNTADNSVKERNILFNIGDTVEPYVFGANGKDKPMSTYKDGSPKKFSVRSRRLIYDGALWQELGIQEVKQS